MKNIITICFMLCFTVSALGQNNKRAIKVYQKAINAAAVSEYDEAIQLCNLAIKLSEPDYKSEFMLFKGMTYQIMEEEQLALNVYDEIIALDGYHTYKAKSFRSLLINKKDYRVKVAQESNDEKDKEETITKNPDLDLSIENLQKTKGKSIGIDVPFAAIETVPVYPGCERLTTNAERKNCMSQKIQKFINRKFDTDIGTTFDLEGKIRILVQFKINTVGEVIGIQSRSPNKYISLEAERVVNDLPIMKPGMQHGKPVTVVYSLPIVFQITS